MTHDEHVMVFLFVVAAVGAVIWLVRCISSWAARTHAAAKTAALTSRRYAPGQEQPGFVTWTDDDLTHDLPTLPADEPTRAVIRDGIARAAAAQEEAVRSVGDEAEAYLVRYNADRPFNWAEHLDERGQL